MLQLSISSAVSDKLCCDGNCTGSGTAGYIVLTLLYRDCSPIRVFMNCLCPLLSSQCAIFHSLCVSFWVVLVGVKRDAVSSVQFIWALQVLALCPREQQRLHLTVLFGCLSAAEGIRFSFRRPLLFVPTGGFIPSSSRSQVSTGVMSPM